jgi:hypothetical protein
MVGVKCSVPDERTFEQLLEGNVQGHEAGESQHTTHRGGSECASDPASSLVVGEAQEFNVRLEASDSRFVPTAKTVCRNWLNA